METQTQAFTPSDLAVSVAWKAAIFTFPATYVLQSFASGVLGTVPTALAACAITFLIAKYVARSECRKRSMGLSEDAFLSTAFYYGITVCATYALRIAIIVTDTFSWRSGSGGRGLLSFFGLEEFSVAVVLSSLLLAHVSYVAYYLAVRNEKRP